MQASQDFINQLIVNPRESLNVEIKNWIDPGSKHGQAKIVKAMIAMRNQNSGFLQIGFENATWKPDFKNAPQNVRAFWDQDEMQTLVARYASEPFEVHVRFAMRGGQEFPVLEVESGVRSPVAAKAALYDPDQPDKKLVEDHAVYVRSLSANNTASTTKARHQDWAGLTERCFDNREADIGRFVRRQLGALDPKALGELARVFGNLAQPEQPPQVAAEMFRRYGYDRFQAQKVGRDLGYLPRHGSWEVAVIIAGEIPPTNLDTEFLNLINISNPRYSGWPVWVDSRGFYRADGSPDKDAVPYTFEGGWEAFIHDDDPMDTMRRHLDFWRAEPAGRFYLYRALQDDFSGGPRDPEPMTKLDFTLVIRRTAEAVAVPIAFARAMGADTEETMLHYAFRWEGLRDREISAWSDPGRYVNPGHVCRQHQEHGALSIPLETPLSALGRHVRDVTAPLFSAFSGFAPGPGVVEAITDEVLSRRF